MKEPFSKPTIPNPGECYTPGLKVFHDRFVPERRIGRGGIQNIGGCWGPPRWARSGIRVDGRAIFRGLATHVCSAMGFLVASSATLAAGEESAAMRELRLRTERAEQALEGQKALARLHWERANLEEGRAWFERAKSAEKDRKPLLAAMLAGRALGYRGLGWMPADEPAWDEAIRPLLGEPFANGDLEAMRRNEALDTRRMLGKLRHLAIPAWSTPHQDLDPPTYRMTAVSIDPAGRFVASGSEDHAIRLHDAATGVRTQQLDGHAAPVRALAHSPDGAWLASGSSDGDIRIWHTGDYTLARCLDGHGDEVTSLSFDTRSGMLVSGSRDQSVRIWNPATGEQQAMIKAGGLVLSVAVDKAGANIAAGLEDSRIVLWKPEEDEIHTTLEGHESMITCLWFLPGGDFLASGSGDGTVRLWDLKSGGDPVVASMLSGHHETAMVHAITATRDEDLLLVSAASWGPGEWDYGPGELKLWNWKTNKIEAAIDICVEPVRSMQFSADGWKLAAGSGEHGVKFLEWDVNRELRSWRDDDERLRDVALSPDGTLLARVSIDGDLVLLDVATGRLLLDFSRTGKPIRRVAFEPAGQKLAASSDDGVMVWDLGTFWRPPKLLRRGESVRSMAWGPDGGWLAGGVDREVVVWDVASGEVRLALDGHQGEVTCLAASPCGSLLASVSRQDHRIILWNRADGTIRAEFASGADVPMTAVAFSPDGEFLAVGTESGGHVRLLDAKTGERVMHFEGHLNAIDHLAFIGDGALLAASSASSAMPSDTWPLIEETILVWDLESGGEQASFSGQNAVSARFGFSAGGSMIAAGAIDTSLKLWPVNGESPDLMRLIRGDFINLERDQLTWNHEALQQQGIAPPAYLRVMDGHARLAAGDLDPVQTAKIRLASAAMSGNARVVEREWDRLPPEVQRGLAVARVEALVTTALNEIRRADPDWRHLDFCLRMTAESIPAISPDHPRAIMLLAALGREWTERTWPAGTYDVAASLILQILSEGDVALVEAWVTWAFAVPNAHPMATPERLDRWLATLNERRDARDEPEIENLLEDVRER